MKAFVFTFFVLALAAHSAPAQTPTRYLASLPDIPLMPQMAELNDADVSFDKAEGRIVEEAVSARGLSVESIAKFYAETLPPLGWKRAASSASSRRFFRNGEQLIVNLDKLADEGFVTFAVSPIQP